MKLTIGLSYAPLSEPKFRKYYEALEHAAENLEHDIEVFDLHAAPDRYAARSSQLTCTGSRYHDTGKG